MGGAEKRPWQRLSPGGASSLSGLVGKEEPLRENRASVLTRRQDKEVSRRTQKEEEWSPS